MISVKFPLFCFVKFF